MTELSRKEANSKSILANILDKHDNITLRNSQKPLPFECQNGTIVLPSLVENAQPQEEHGPHVFPNVCPKHNMTLPTQTYNKYLANHDISSWPYPLRVKDIHCKQVMEKKYTKKKGAIETELKDILREIRVITDKIRDEVNGTGS